MGMEHEPPTPRQGRVRNTTPLDIHTPPHVRQLLRQGRPPHTPLIIPPPVHQLHRPRTPRRTDMILEALNMRCNTQRSQSNASYKTFKALENESKSDIIVKALDVFQIVYLIIQLIMQGVENLAAAHSRLLSPLSGLVQ